MKREQEQGEDAGGAAGAEGPAEAEGQRAEEAELAPARKKAKRNASRKRLDPIVREALMSADQGERWASARAKGGEAGRVALGACFDKTEL